MSRKTITETLLNELNIKRGLASGDIGYSYWADVRGNGLYRPSIWQIINAGGGVTSSGLNHRNAQVRIRRIRDAIAATPSPF